MLVLKSTLLSHLTAVFYSYLHLSSTLGIGAIQDSIGPFFCQCDMLSTELKPFPSVSRTEYCWNNSFGVSYNRTIAENDPPKRR